MTDKKKKKEGIVQDEELFLYKLYAILSEYSRPKNLWSNFHIERSWQSGKDIKNTTVINKDYPILPTTLLQSYLEK